MAYNKTKRYRNNRGKNKSSHKKSTIHKKRRNSRKISSKMRKGGNPPISDTDQKFYDIRGEGAAMIASITSIEKLDMLEEKMKTQPVVYNIFKELIDVHREALEK